MSTALDILTNFQSLIAGETAFSDAHIYLSKERKGFPRHDMDLFLYPGKPNKVSTEYRGEFRVYPINLLVRLQAYSRVYEENVVDPTDEMEWKLEDAGMSLAKRYQGEGKCFLVEIDLKVDDDFQASEELKQADKDAGQTVHRILFTFNAFTSEGYPI